MTVCIYRYIHSTTLYEVRNLLGLALKCTWVFAMHGQEMLVLFNTVGLCVLNN